MVNAPQQLPVLGSDFPLDAPNGWHEANRYLLYTGHFALDGPAIAIQEAIGNATETLPLRNRSLSLIPAGTLHRLTHLAGFWRMSDADLIVLRAELPEALYLALYVSSGPLHTTERVFWICQSCGTELAPWTYDVRRFGALAFWNKLVEPVRSFTADLKTRTCQTCGAVHQLAYGFAPENDTDEERIARTEW